MQPRPLEEFYYTDHAIATAPTVVTTSPHSRIQTNCESSYFLQNFYTQQNNVHAPRPDFYRSCETIPLNGSTQIHPNQTQVYYPALKASPPFFQESPTGLYMDPHQQQPQPRSSSDPVQYSKCMVCDDIADGYHFNALSCAACSAFFRRSIADQKTYTCVTKNCSVSINTRKHGVICRYCRFQKCIIAGMIPDEVQCKRVKPGASAPYPQPSKELTYRARSHRNNGGNGGGNGGGGTHSSASSTGSRSPRTPLLNEITNARREIGQNRLSSLNVSLNLGYHHQNGFAHAQNLNKTFPPISSMSSYAQQRNALFGDLGLFRNYTRLIGALQDLEITPETNTEVRDMFIVWLIIETTYCTVRFGGVQTNRVYFCNLCFLEVAHQNMVMFFGDGNFRDPECLARFCHPIAEYFITSVCRAVQGIKLDEKEIAALSALLFFSLPSHTSPHNNNRHNNERRQQVFAELADHYRFSEHDIALRMGNLVMLMSTFEEMFFMVKEFISSIEIFGGQMMI